MKIKAGKVKRKKAMSGDHMGMNRHVGHVGHVVDSSSWTGHNAGSGNHHHMGLGGGGGSNAGLGGGGGFFNSVTGIATGSNGLQQQSQSMMDYVRHMAILQARQQLQGEQMYGIQASTFPALGSGEVVKRYEEDEETMTVVEVVKPIFKPVDSVEFDLEEYMQLANTVGISIPDLLIEKFKAFLRKSDIPVYNLKEVVTYMDAKARKESKQQAGWRWRPLRWKDSDVGYSFGTEASHQFNGKITPASDHYSHNQPVYDKIIPMHALKKVALIGKEFDDRVKMMVCDYEVKPEYRPDPFLMAVIPNTRLRDGNGRFIIDFWDEPGFGLESQLK